MNADYKATGEQLRIPPWATGVSMAAWRATQPACSGRELRAFLAQRRAVEEQRAAKHAAKIAKENR